MEALHALSKAIEQGGVPARDARPGPPARQPDQRLQRLRRHARAAMRKAGETDERLFAVAAWRDAPYFTDGRARRARADRGGHAARRPRRPGPRRGLGRGGPPLRREGLAALILAIAAINVWNRLNATVGQVAGQWRRLTRADSAPSCPRACRDEQDVGAAIASAAFGRLVAGERVGRPVAARDQPAAVDPAAGQIVDDRLGPPFAQPLIPVSSPRLSVLPSTRTYMPPAICTCGTTCRLSSDIASPDRSLLPL